MAKRSGSSKSGKAAEGWTASAADRHDLYEASVQNVEAEIDFVDKQYKKLRGRHATRLREDFCGTGATSMEWAKRRSGNSAVGLDIDGPTLKWGIKRIKAHDSELLDRVSLLQRDVLEPGDATGVDIVLAMNFSYWLFKQREELIGYLRSVRESLADDGMFICDFYGGQESMKECQERRKCKVEGKGKFVYVWDQHKYNPITGEMKCRIHFEFPDGTAKRNAFKYDWRLWGLRELQDVLRDAGFSKTTVYWEGDDGDGEGNGVFKASKTGAADPAYICYLISEK